MAKIEQRDIEGAHWYQVKEGGETVGFAISSLDSQGKVVLDSIHVIPGRRKSGVGSALLGAVKSWGKDKGATKIMGGFSPEFRGGEDEEAARKFYARHGITITEEDKLEGDI